MNEEEEQAKQARLRERADQIREEQRERYGRIASASENTSGASETTGGGAESVVRDDATPDHEVRAAVQAPGRTPEPLAPTGRKPDIGSRGAASYQSRLTRLDRGSRPGSDRRSEGDERPVDDSAASFDGARESSGRASVGRLEADGETVRIGRPEPNFAERQEERAVPATNYKEDYYPSKRGGKRVYVHIDGHFIAPDEWKLLKERPTPEPVKFESPRPAAPPKERLFGKSQVLTQQEITELAEPFREALKDIGGYTDQGLWLLNPSEKGNDIWGDLTDIEAELLAKHLFKLGQRSPVVAVAIRETVHMKDYAAIAAILWPRIVRTKKLVDSAPPRAKKKRSLFRVVEGTTA